MIWTNGYVASETREGSIVILTKLPPVNNLSNEVAIGWKDERTITLQQRRLIWALVGEINAAWNEGRPTIKHLAEGVNNVHKQRFLQMYFDELSVDCIKRFSTSDCDMTTARLYIDYLIDFIVQMGIPTKYRLAEKAQDIERYMFSCLKYKKCAVCGKKADFHHVDRVGMGRNRTEIVHEGVECEPLCRLHHEECHTMPQKDFDKRYHLTPIKATKEICDIYKLKKQEGKK